MADIRSPGGRRSSIVFAVALATIGLQLLLVGGAMAESHAFTGYFGDATHNPTDPYPLSKPTAVAVDNSSGPSAHDIYVADAGNHRIEKFDPSGKFILMFGQEVNRTTGGNICTAVSGDICQPGAAGPSPGAFLTPTYLALDGSSGPSAGDIYVGDTGSDVVSKFLPSGALVETWGTAGQLGGFGAIYGVATEKEGNLFVMGALGDQNEVARYDQDGEFVDQFRVNVGYLCRGGLAVDGEGGFYRICEGGSVSKFSEKGESLGNPGGGAHGIAVNPITNELYVDEGEGSHGAEAIRHYIACNEGCAPIDTFGNGELQSSEGLDIDSGTGTVYVANTGAGNVAAFESTVPTVSTGAAENLGETTATLTGHVDPNGKGNVTECYFEYGTNTSYESGALPCEPDSNFGAATNVTAKLSKLRPEGSTYHYRLVAENGSGVSFGGDRSLSTTEAPTIDALRATNLTESGAELEARIDPGGLETTYQFEYGTSIDYGTSVPAAPESIGSGESPQTVRFQLAGLQPTSTYHFRVVATNALGTTTTDDQTFNYLPPSCPNASVRQQTKTSFLPDCRAYELVSASDSNGTLLEPNSTNSPYADDTYAYSGTGGEIPNSGDPQNSLYEDLYVARREPTGWVTHFVGIPGDEASNSQTTMTDLTEDRFLAFENEGVYYSSPAPPGVTSSAPYIYTSRDELLGQWPTSLAIIPGGSRFKGALQASPDFTHLAFSSNNVAFVPSGLTSAPGSAYDFNTITNETVLISKSASGANIRQEPGVNNPEEAIAFGKSGSNDLGRQWYPPISTNGSHILMATEGASGGRRLYMRVDDAVTYEVSMEHDVNYLGMTADGSKVFFTSNEQLTPEDHDSSRDIYMWSEETDSLKDISLGDNSEAGNGDECEAVKGWTEGCSVVTIQPSFSQTDNSISTESGDIYFYSPEQLDAAKKGVPGEENLYVYRHGRVELVKAFAPGESCSVVGFEERCGNGPLERIQVTPNGEYMAFVSNQQVLSYDNNHHSEMYRFTPDTGTIICVSCNPDGSVPTSDVIASDGFPFMSNDGRTVFYTKEALVPQDTDRIHDVYEYVEGRPQLITTGRGVFDTVAIHEPSGEDQYSAGLGGISADGKNIFFSTYDTLVPQDENGNFLKFYDARADGGFLAVPKPAPCEAADECHSQGSAAPGPPQVTSGASLGDSGLIHSGGTGKTAHRRRHHHRSHRRSRKPRSGAAR